MIQLKKRKTKIKRYQRKLFEIMVTIRELNQTDEKLIFHWMMDSELRDNIGTTKKPSLASHQIWFSNKINDSGNKTMIIEFDGMPVGLIGTNHIDRINKNAEIFLYIGDKSFKRKGIGYKSLILFRDYLIKHVRMELNSKEKLRLIIMNSLKN